MHRTVSIQDYTAAIIEALEPRMAIMGHEDISGLEEQFKGLNPEQDLVQGTEMEMIVRGDTMTYWSSIGGIGEIQSEDFCRALCEVYYAEDCVSPSHRDSVIRGIGNGSMDWEGKDVDDGSSKSFFSTFTKGLF